MKEIYKESLVGGLQIETKKENRTYLKNILKNTFCNACSTALIYLLPKKTCRNDQKTHVNDKKTRVNNQKTHVNNQKTRINGGKTLRN